MSIFCKNIRNFETIGQIKKIRPLLLFQLLILHTRTHFQVVLKPFRGQNRPPVNKRSQILVPRNTEMFFFNRKNGQLVAVWALSIYINHKRKSFEDTSHPNCSTDLGLGYLNSKVSVSNFQPVVSSQT